tara:strand:- start:648 stop:1070 length:423 start_codon:yes stop_codon:yes gene_type:complete
MVKLVILLFIFSCQPASISPHTKRGQAKIDIKQVQTPYHIQHIVTNGIVPLTVKWEGPANKMVITVEYIIRPTSPRIRFPLYQQNMMGNYYTVYRDLYPVKNMNEFEGTLSVHEKGDYRIKVFLSNDYWYETRSSRFKIY